MHLHVLYMHDLCIFHTLYAFTCNAYESTGTAYVFTGIIYESTCIINIYMDYI